MRDGVDSPEDFGWAVQLRYRFDPATDACDLRHAGPGRGTALAYGVEPVDSDEQLKSAFGPTMIAGSMTRQELADRYAEQSGISVNGILFYYCFGLFKLAVIVQQIYARYVRGQTRDPRFADLNQRVAVLARTALRAITAGRM